MKNKLSIALLLLTTIVTFAQNKFEPGYYIDNSGIKTECLIKNYNWKSNPTSFEIKNNPEDIASTKSIAEVKEFYITNKVKFIRETVKIDETPSNINSILTDPNPIFKESTIFLKVLVEGSSNLYYFENESYNRYFYTNKDKTEQLVYRLYKKNDGDIVANNLYKQQLYTNFKCNNDQETIEALKYNDDLIDYFIKTNNCISGKNDAKIITERRNFDINLKINVLVNRDSQTYSSGKTSYSSENQTSIGFGFEAEIILPYNNGNWSVVMDPYYYKFDKPLLDSKGKLVFDNETSVFKLPLGIRRYFSLNHDNKFFANAAINFNTSITTPNFPVKTNNSFNFSFGVGYQYKRINLELKLNPKTRIGGNELVNEKYIIKQTSLKLGYRIL